MITLAQPSVLFDEATHTYTTHDGEILSGITHRIKERVFPDEYVNVPKSVLERAAKRGSLIHSYIEMYDKYDIITSGSPELDNYINNASAENPWLRSHIDSEYLVTDGKQFASAIDKVYQCEDGVILGDIKTTYTLNEDYVSWQLSVYAYFFSLANPDVEIKGLYALWFREDKYRVVKVERKSVEVVKKMLYTDEPLAELIATDDTMKYPDINKAEEALLYYMNAASHYKEKYDEIKAGLLKLMTENDIKKYDGSLLSITRKAAGKCNKFNSRLFKEDHPELYDEYVISSPVSPSLTIKAKS